MDSKLQLAVVGATGVVGREILTRLAERGHPADRVTALASERSAGVEVDYGGETLEVEAVTPESFHGIAGAFLATPAAVSLELSGALRKEGCWAVDLSSAFRTDSAVPLLFPQGESSAPSGAKISSRLARSPAPLTSELLKVLVPLQKAQGLEAVTVTAMFGAAVAGNAGVRELETQTAHLLSGREAPEVEEGRFPYRLAFNLIPQVGGFTEGNLTEAEKALIDESARLGVSVPWSSVTALWVPTFYGVIASVAVSLKNDASPELLAKVLGPANRVKQIDAPGDKVYPMPMLTSSDDHLHLGRIRAMGQGQRWFSFVLAWDNAAAAASNALDAFEALVARSE
jgi:aspartate-semialdehyde dehydrogenase